MKALLFIALLLPAQGKPAIQRVIPPAEYDKPYLGNLTITKGESPARLKELCPGTAFPIVLGCVVRPDQHNCHIYVAGDATIKSYGFTTEIVIRHEMGHCNGWSGYHEGARPLD